MHKYICNVHTVLILQIRQDYIQLCISIDCVVQSFCVDVDTVKDIAQNIFRAKDATNDSPTACHHPLRPKQNDLHFNRNINYFNTYTNYASLICAFECKRLPRILELLQTLQQYTHSHYNSYCIRSLVKTFWRFNFTLFCFYMQNNQAYAIVVSLETQYTAFEFSAFRQI